jgi:hypothetical protein
LGGGFPPKALYLIQGDPGVVKTTLALQFLLAGVRGGESCLYITFSETSAELSVVARSHGWSLDGISILELSNYAQQLTAEAESTLFDPADIELQDVTKIIFDEVERIPRSRLIDSRTASRSKTRKGVRSVRACGYGKSGKESYRSSALACTPSHSIAATFLLDPYYVTHPVTHDAAIQSPWSESDGVKPHAVDQDVGLEII